jgi:hypothetical protein
MVRREPWKQRQIWKWRSRVAFAQADAGALHCIATTQSIASHSHHPINQEDVLDKGKNSVHSHRKGYLDSTFYLIGTEKALFSRMIVGRI